MAFDPTGLAVGWLYDDESVVPMTDEAWKIVAEPNMAQFRMHTVKVRAVSENYETSFNIVVYNTDTVLSSITASYAANKVQDLGLDFDKKNLTVTGHFSDGSTKPLTSYAVISGYDKRWRGEQTVTAKVNGKTAAFTVTSRLGDTVSIAINTPFSSTFINDNHQIEYKNSWIKGEPFTGAKSGVIIFYGPTGDSAAYRGKYGGTVYSLSYGPGGLSDADFAATIAAYKPNQPGKQSVPFSVDGRNFTLDLFVVDAEPDVWFDYGYMRHAGNPNGVNWEKNNAAAKGKYYARPQETLVIAPVRYLVGFNADHTDAAGTTYSWTVSGGVTHTTSNDGEFLHVTPTAAGTCAISVTVTGKNYIDGENITKTASTELVCYTDTGSFIPGTFGEAIKQPTGTLSVKPPLANGRMLRHMGPGQMSEGGTGIGWSLGSAGGYEVWTVAHQPSYVINGNAFSAWHEAGIVWAQEDRNGNGLPDEMWYEVRGGDDDDPAWKNAITRRYAITYVKGSEYGTVNQYDQIIREVYWADSRGRSGMIPGGFPRLWGVVGDWVTYTTTLLRDDGNIAVSNYSGLVPMPGYVDALGNIFSIDKAMKADGIPVTLSAVSFIKVQTSVFRYGGNFGDVSTEIQSADYLGVQTDFPMP
jgi:hypothetical protein